MTSNKWREFHKAYTSTIDIRKANMGDADLQADWSRESKQDRMLINGIPLKIFAEHYNQFSKEEDVESFFKDIILQNINPENKVEAMEFLKKTFHQGGYLYLVSSPLAVSMTEYSKEYDQEVPYATVQGNNPEATAISINLVTTDKGFKIQENTTFYSLIVSPDFCKEYKLSEDNPILSPEQGSDYIIKTQGTLDFDFSKTPGSPKINIENNAISFGHSAIQEKMDKRNLGQIIVDFFKKIIGVPHIKDISPKDSKVELPNTSDELTQKNQKDSPSFSP